MSGDFSVQSVVVEALNRLRVSTSVPGESVDGCDPGDCLSPGCWVLSGQLGRTVCLVDTPSREASSTNWILRMTGDLLFGLDASIGLAPFARGALGHVVDTTPVSFVVPKSLAVADQRAGVLAADLVTPLAGSDTGDVGVIGALEALKKRIALMISTVLGSFKHMLTFGQGLSPKRTYTKSAIEEAAALMKSNVILDVDVKTASVRGFKVNGVARFEVYVVPKIGQPFTVNNLVESGTTS